MRETKKVEDKDLTCLKVCVSIAVRLVVSSLPWTFPLLKESGPLLTDVNALK